MAVLYVTHPAFAEHDTGYGHPERPARLQAVEDGIEQVGLGEELVRVAPRRATEAEIERVHSSEYVAALEQFCRSGGGALDGDTVASSASWDAAVLAAGAGLSAMEALRAGDATSSGEAAPAPEPSAAFCAVRPPGHHAVTTHAMGFCLFNNLAVTAAALAAAGDRVLIVDIDAHHGNGTQAMFYDDSQVAYVSFHQSPLYPGTGSVFETGGGEGQGLNVNFPLPQGATGDVYRQGTERVVARLAEEHRPDWLLVSAGFDGHRSDPLTNLGLSAGDFADLTRDLLWLAPAGRRVLFLEGGYDLAALRTSTAALFAALEGEVRHDEAPTSAGPGGDVVTAAEKVHARSLHR